MSVGERRVCVCVEGELESGYRQWEVGCFRRGHLEHPDEPGVQLMHFVITDHVSLETVNQKPAHV